MLTNAFYKVSTLFLLMYMPIMAWSGCSINSNGLIFGSYNVFDMRPIDRVGTIEVQCDENTEYTLKLGRGNGSYTNRVMRNQAEALNYNLYTDASHLFVWGDGTNGTNIRSGQTMNVTQYYVYGRIFPKQNVSVGYYSDVVLVTLEY